ncbi:hypothetical protein [Lactobacillus helveticus]|uniref:hypothetical protein n=1 Tax=Lactobacillus helveticus TaxID=1587 RepID=UPI0015626DC6|nr:hypothetical protein [Lactobacillus helveticus]
MVDKYTPDSNGVYKQNVFSQFHHEPMPNYKFHEIGIYAGDISEVNPDAGIKFNGFDSAKAGWWLSKREFSTPEEYEVVDSVPYQQGEYDFSVLDNQRFFKARTIKYEFLIIDDDPQYRQGSYDQGKNELMMLPYNDTDVDNAYMDLLDTGSPAYKFNVKCKSVSSSDDDEQGVMTVTVEFKGDPFALSRSLVGTDIWDEIDFDNYFTQQTYFDINGELLLSLDNLGMPTPVELEIDNSSNIVIRWPGEDRAFPTVVKPITKSGSQITYGGNITKILPSGTNNNIGFTGKGSVRLNFRYRMMY